MQKAAQLIHLLAFLLVMALGISTRVHKDSPQPNVAKLTVPSGAFGVGRVGFDWIDPNRAADMAEDRGPHSELMVYLWYPTEAISPEVKSTLFPGAKQIDSSADFSAFLKAKVFGGNWPLVVSGAITTHAQENVPIAKSPKVFPVVLFSPGAFGMCFQYSSAIEDLVGHGYVVAAIEHTSEVFGELFLDGKIHVYSPARIPNQAIPPPGSSKQEYEVKLEKWYPHNRNVQAPHISFTLNKSLELTRPSHPASHFPQLPHLDHPTSLLP